MYQPDSQIAALILMFITMICWGSWANTQKLCKNWRFELFYWDYVFGVVLTSLLFAITLGNLFELNTGTNFLTSFLAAAPVAKSEALLSGMIFNIANVLLVAAIAMAGMAIAFPVAIGIALIMGTVLSYWVQPDGQILWLLLGVGLVVFAIYCDAKIYSKVQQAKKTKHKRGLIVALVSGILMGSFYPLIAKSMATSHALDPYAANLYFAIGVLICNVPVNRLLMRFPIAGEPVTFADYRRGGSKAHLLGLLGGFIWCVGMSLNLVASKTAGPAVAYAFGQGATMIAAVWGVFIWREFKGVAEVRRWLVLMFGSYCSGLVLIGFSSLV